jgi:hypothetical protein
MPFEKGQSGCPGGRSKNRPWRDAIARAVAKAVEGKVNYTRLDELAERLVAEGLAGDTQAMKEIGDRLDGKAIQAIANDDDGAPFVVKIVRPGPQGTAE